MTYIFDNAAPVARRRLSALADVYDPNTIAALDARGVAEGWTCLEVGGGLGTITRWLSQRVGARGRVFATDIDTRFLDELGLDNVDVRCHDILTSPLPSSTFDLAYARLVLEHLSDPDLALRRMIAALKPGGWIVVQDMELMPVVAGSHEPQDRISATAAVMRDVVAAAGVNPRVGPSLGRRLRDCRLDHVGCEGRLWMCRGNSTAARLTRLNFEQMRERLLASGRLTNDQFDADVALLQNDDYEWRSPILWTAWGQRPVDDMS
jgi:SAM-dependent methyltransferase